MSTKTYRLYDASGCDNKVRRGGNGGEQRFEGSTRSAEQSRCDGREREAPIGQWRPRGKVDLEACHMKNKP